MGDIPSSLDGLFHGKSQHKMDDLRDNNGTIMG